MWGTRRFQCDLSATVSLGNRLLKSEHRGRALDKAEKAGVAISEGPALIDRLWRVLRENLERKHSARPVHDEAEIRLLAERFPEQIRFMTGWCDDELVAGVVVFVAGPVHHAQYIAASERGQAINALDAVLEACLEHA